MASIISPNMNLIVPGVGTEAGPTYAIDINTSLTLIDQHDHSPGKGVQISVAGLNIDANLSLNDFSLIDATSIVFTASGSASTTPQSLSVAPGGESPQQQDLWYTPDTGVPIQITKNGIVNTVASSIPGESYAAGTFFWTQAQDALPTTPANFDIGSVTIRPNVALTTFGVRLQPASAISSQYSINLPLIPVVKNIVTLDTSGNMVADTNVDNSTIEIVANNLRVKAQGITAAQIANGTITTTQISPTAGITQGQLADDALAWRIQQFTLITPSFTVRVATTTSGTFATAFDNASTVDGVVLATNDIILIKNQASAQENGIFVVQASGTPVRHTSYNTPTTLQFAAVSVTAGTVNSGKDFYENNFLAAFTDTQAWSNNSTELYIIPDGVNELVVQGCGGGGGGGGSAFFAGGGGGAGALLSPLVIIPVTPGDQIAVTVGAGGIGSIGVAAPASASAGGSGGNSSINYPSGVIKGAMFPGASGGGGGIDNGSSGTGGVGGSTYASTILGMFSAVGTGGAGGGYTGSGNGPPGNAAPTINLLQGGPITGAAGGTGSTGGITTSGGGGGGSTAFGVGGVGGQANNGGTGVPQSGFPGVNYGTGGGGESSGTSALMPNFKGGNGAPGTVIFYYLKGGA